MAAPQDAPEQAFRLRKFQGTNTEIDSTFIGPSYVARSENWIPSQSYRLGKRPGTTLLQSLAGHGVTDVTALLAIHAPDGTPYLYAYGRRASDAVVLVMVAEQAAIYDPPAVSFVDGAAIGRLVAFRDRVYAGNGVDPIKSWKLGEAAAATQTYGVLATLSPGGTVTSQDNPNNYSGPAIRDGEYYWCFALFNTATGLYISRGTPAKFLAGPGANGTGVTALVTAPATALPASHVYRFFVTPRNFPIEYATAQGADWTAAEVRTISQASVSELRCPTAGVMRTGNMFVVWRNRVVFSGMRDDPYSVFATDTILPGLEQSVYNQGTMFPVSAKVRLPAALTGIGVAGVTTDMDATAPLLFFTISRTFIVSGDPFSLSEPATMEEVSSRIGCVGHDSITNTPEGTLFCGMDSVYLIPRGGGYPQDVGWPVANQIRQIPPALRARVVATFHKQFYKLAIPQSGGASNDQQWWLDLRQGVGQTPSWWGPMTGYAVSAMASDPSHIDEIDRGYAAYASSDQIVRTHQTATYTDYVPGAVNRPIRSILKSGRYDADQPFIPKVITRIRLIAQSFIKTSIKVIIETDGGTSWGGIDDIQLAEEIEEPARWVHLVPTAPPPPPRYSDWRFAKFVTIAPVEAQTITPYTRPRGLSCVVTLDHNPQLNAALPVSGVGNIELRDFELLFLLSGRKARYVGFTTNNVRKPPERVSK